MAGGVPDAMCEPVVEELDVDARELLDRQHVDGAGDDGEDPEHH
jgi:hypothetical protein